MEGLSAFAVRRGVTTSMLYMILIGFGFFSLMQLKLDLFPELKFPIVAIVNSYSGVSPEEMETLVTRPMEQAIAAVKNVKKIRSTSKLGNSMIIVELEWGSDIDKAMLDMREKIDIIKKQLPEEARQPFLFAFDPSLQPIMLLAVSGRGNMVKLRDFITKRISPMVERIGGVASASVNGGQKREIQVLLNPRKLRGFGISVSQIIRALQAESVQVASGSLNQGSRELGLRTISSFQKVDDIGKVVIGVKGKPVPQPVYLSQVAKIVDTHEEQTRIIQSQGREGMLLFIQKRSDANTVQTAQNILKALPKLRKRLPEGTKIGVLFNQSDFIVKSLSNLTSSGLQAFVLAILVLFFFLRSLRTSFIIALSIPASVILTFAVMYYAGVTLNIISMAGLALAVGMLVDNSIVVLENVFRHFEEGASSWEAAIRGSSEVALAITASTLTTLAVFIPILFVKGLAGMMFRDMVVTICFSLTASLIVALTLIPLLASRILRRKPLPDVTADTEEESASPAEPAKSSWLERTYVRTLNWSLHHRKSTIAIGLATFVLSLGVMGALKTEFLPKADDSMLMIQYEGAPGTALKDTIKTAATMEKIIRQKFGKILETVLIEAGTGEGFIALFGKGAHAGLVRVRLKPISERTLRKWDIEKILQREFARLPGVKITFQDGGAAFSGGGDVEVQLLGHDLKVAKELAQKIKRVIARIPNVTQVKTSLEEGRPELQIRLNRERLQRLGLNGLTVGTAISTAFKGTTASLFRQGDNEYRILLRLQKRYRRNVQDLKKLYIITPAGSPVPLGSIADIRYALSPVKIERQNQQRVTTVSVSVARAHLGSVVKAVPEAIKRHVAIPPTFTYRIGGTAEDFIESFMFLGLALLVSVILVYMVMASQFESLFEPFVILFSIPLALVGVFAALLVTDTSLSVMAFVGIIMLAGIVVNNAIVLVDFIKQLRDEHQMGILEACLEAGRVRMRPILMTAATTIFGMLPMALGLGEGAENWVGLGRVVMGGLFSSTFLTLLVVPTLYAMLALWGERRKARKQAKQAARAMS
jgi:HAE1 family hydrophobic/amphiphilic exporter-1